MTSARNRLAQIALAIQDRWDVPTFVKMHEIVIVEEDGNTPEQKIPPQNFQRGIGTIFENLEMGLSFRLFRTGKAKYRITRIPGSPLPRWMMDIEAPVNAPDGVFVCPHCVPPDTLILGDNKLIPEYANGDNAMGQTGLSEVIQTFVRPYKGEMISIKANGMLPIITTPEHPILVTASRSITRTQGQRRLNEILFSDERWVAAKDVVAKKTNKDGNYVILPIIKGSFERHEVGLFPFIKKEIPHHRGYRDYFPLSEDTAWLLGLYTAEGSATKEVRFSLSSNEKEIKAKVSKIARGLGYSTYTRYLKNANSMLVNIPSRVLS